MDVLRRFPMGLASVFGLCSGFLPWKGKKELFRFLSPDDTYIQSYKF
jgi:hypothetical protein